MYKVNVRNRFNFESCTLYLYLNHNKMTIELLRHLGFARSWWQLETFKFLQMFHFSFSVIDLKPPTPENSGNLL